MTAGQWLPTRALGRAVLVTGLLLIAGVILGRVDLVALAAPFAVGTAYALRRRPAAAPVLDVGAVEGDLVEGGQVGARVAAANPADVGYDLVVVRALVSPWLRIDELGLLAATTIGDEPAGAADGAPDGGGSAGPGAATLQVLERFGAPARLSPSGGVPDRPFGLVVPTGSAAGFELGGIALRWGRPAIGPVAARAVACDGLLACRPLVAEPVRVPVYPVTEPFDADEAMPRAAGLVGGHRSRRPGEGGELAGVRIFGPGDRLRRIDWRVSLRARQLHVAATLSDRDAEVVLLLDVLTEVGRSGGFSGGASVLDTTVRAAAAVAEHYLHRGDRVAMLEYGPLARRLRPATGRRQYLTVLEWLLDVEVRPTPYEPYDQVFGPQLLSSDALVVVLTPLVDPRSAEMLARMARSGRIVVAVDTLPTTVAPPPRGGPWTEAAYGLWRLDRDNTIGQLREHGVPVVTWAGAGSLDQVLRDVSRLASAPKAVLR
ncbi:DUF58 domain-containing protein [Micromonospora sp. LOL_023]|uniref:DUF58 domain-containing protein n=1 Tax=Micromonospora sp. LOL_023 TaxID=3345418 RepID=UPI003A866F63